MNNKNKPIFFSIFCPSRVTGFTIGCMMISAPTNALNLTLQVESKAITSELVDFVAEIGKYQTVNIKKGQTVQDVIVGHCGQFDARYFRVLKREIIEGLPIQMTKNARIEVDQSIQLPECIRVQQYVVRTKEINPGDAPLKYYMKDNAGFTNENTYLDKFKELNKDFNSVTNQIKVGEKVDIPLSTLSWSSIDVDSVATNNSNVNIEKHIMKLLKEGGQNKILQEDPEDIQLYSQLTEEDIKEKGWCKQPTDGTAIASFDTVELVNVVSYNLEMLRLNRSRGNPSKVIIADTGLYATESTPFSKLRIADRYFSSSLYPNLDKKIQPYLGHSKHQHGTYVATQVFGGTKFLEMFGSNLDIRLAPLNIFKDYQDICVNNGKAEECTKYKIRTDVFNSVFKSAEEKSAIVNLSVGRQVKFTGLEMFLNKDKHALYVVAAGNDGRQLMGRNVYPAKYGGKDNAGQYNLITVASINQSGGRAGFSNYGSKYVDIAAPGCSQEVFAFDKENNSFRRTRVSGTSLSAPLVSFTAAMIKAFSLNETTPLFIKQRIFTGADINKPLMSDVKDGRVLNVVKAISLYQDIIEAIIDGKKRLVRGTINKKQKEFNFCGESFYRKTKSGSNIIKKVAVVNDPVTAEKRVLIYTLVDNVLNSQTCSFEKFSLTIHEDFTGQQFDLESKDIIDVVFAEVF